MVVSTDDQIVSAIEKNSKNVIRIYRTNTDPSLGSNAMIFVGLGAVVTDDGIIVTDSSLISEGGKYFTTTPDNKLLDLSVVSTVSGGQVVLLKIQNDEKNPLTFSKVSFLGDANSFDRSNFNL